jgi:transcription elongation factor GreA
MSEKFPITTNGFDAMKAELANLISRRSEISERIATAREHGDLKENAEYHAAREQQSFNEGKVAELEDKISRAEVIDLATLDGDTVKFGATVNLLDEDTDKKVTYQIVGEYEANIENKLVSIASPLARALIGKTVDESVEVKTPKGEKCYTILAISYGKK